MIWYVNDLVIITFDIQWNDAKKISFFSIIIVEFLQPVQTPFSAPLTTPDLAITDIILGIALLNTLHHQEYDGRDVKFKTPWRRKPFSQWHGNFQLKPTLSLAQHIVWHTCIHMFNQASNIKAFKYKALYLAREQFLVKAIKENINEWNLA